MVCYRSPSGTRGALEPVLDGIGRGTKSGHVKLKNCIPAYMRICPALSSIFVRGSTCPISFPLEYTQQEQYSQYITVNSIQPFRAQYGTFFSVFAGLSASESQGPALEKKGDSRQGKEEENQGVIAFV